MRQSVVRELVSYTFVFQLKIKMNIIKPRRYNERLLNWGLQKPFFIVYLSHQNVSLVQNCVLRTKLVT